MNTHEELSAATGFFGVAVRSTSPSRTVRNIVHRSWAAEFVRTGARALVGSIMRCAGSAEVRAFPFLYFLIVAGHDLIVVAHWGRSEDVTESGNVLNHFEISVQNAACLDFGITGNGIINTVCDDIGCVIWVCLAGDVVSVVNANLSDRDLGCLTPYVCTLYRIVE